MNYPDMIHRDKRSERSGVFKPAQIDPRPKVAQEG